ncbi:acyltransferase family protein [Leucobacter chromiiresistens]|uniref:acyltransferase family protein n=1 Tax=Leucobacter chromiiresistens TaxID=1079994 RepID=UPI0009429740|nr:acyltransferase [Leucobacter chromiiresistens]
MTGSRPAAPTPTVARSPGYRHDIDGLRAVAVLLVVVYHVWLGRVSGGVDAFLMISAFLLTGALMRRWEATGRVGVAGQWIRNFKRMLPAAAIVIAATVVIGMRVLPASTHDELWRHAWASLTYTENWLLAAEAADYYADQSQASPLQHFWSLSVQGQVFILWPLLFLLIGLIARCSRGRIPARRIAIAVFGAVLAVSLAYSIVATRADQTLAYFDTRARLWEFAAGSILALVVHRLRLPVIPRAVIGWTGLGALVACGLVLDVQGGFPGYLALWPVLSVAAVIVSGNDADRRYGPAMLLEQPRVLALGRSSYALYLVHWPALVCILVARDGQPLNLVEGLIVILGSIVVARLLTGAVDAPLRRLDWIERSRWRGLGVIALSAALVAGVVVPAQVTAQRQLEAEQRAIAEAEAQRVYRNPGARVLFDDWTGRDVPGAPLRPLPAELDDQWGTLSRNCGDGSVVDIPATVPACLDNEVGADEAERTVVVVGDSHAQQMLAPIGAVAERENWRVVSFLLGACAFGLRDIDEDRGGYYRQECRDWNVDVIRLIEEIEPDAVVTIGTRTEAADAESPRDAGERETVPEGLERTVDRLARAGIPTVLIRDNPRFTYDAYRCVEESPPGDGVDAANARGAGEAGEAGDAGSACGVDAHQALAASSPLDALASPHVAALDFSDYYCPKRCPAVIGNVAVYIDKNHLSTFYLGTLEPVIGRELDGALARLDEFSATAAAG